MQGTTSAEIDIINSYRNRTDDIVKDIKGKRRFKSENIIENLINEVLTKDFVYSRLYVRYEYLLYLLTPPPPQKQRGLLEREIRFLTNRLSRVDFLIVNGRHNSLELAIN